MMPDIDSAVRQWEDPQPGLPQRQAGSGGHQNSEGIETYIADVIYTPGHQPPDDLVHPPQQRSRPQASLAGRREQNHMPLV